MVRYVELAHFERQYEKWYTEAREEFENSEFYEDSYGIDFEIADNGDVHIQGHLFHVIKKAVTPWEESEHYVK